MLQDPTSQTTADTAPARQPIAQNDDKLVAPPVSGAQPAFRTSRIGTYLRDLSPEFLEPSSSGARPIAERTATTFGTKSLPHFAGLKYREALNKLSEFEAEYARYGTPITRRVEKALAQLDGGEAALVFRSGMAAIEKVIDSVLPTNGSEIGHLIVGTEGYRQTRNILDRMVARKWVELSVIGMSEFDEVHKHLKPNTKAVFFETPSNPFLRVIDVRGVKEQIVAAGSSALVIVDHTFAGPTNQKPLEQGADLVVPSLTKYISGTNDVLAGAVIGNKELLLPIFALRSQCGNIAHDNDCLGVEQGLKTLVERAEAANENGLHVATLLSRNPYVTKVWYPGLKSHPDHEIATKQMKGFGGVVSFCIDARDFHDIAAFVDAFIAASPEGTFLAPSFGGDNPLISSVPIVSHFQQSDAEREARGIPDTLLRLSTGIVLAEELTTAIQAGFEALEARKSRS
jgi:cystathionine gamma-synthase